METDFNAIPFHISSQTPATPLVKTSSNQEGRVRVRVATTNDAIKLAASIPNSIPLRVSSDQGGRATLRVATTNETIKLATSIKIEENTNPYDGEYVVDPSFETQILNTKNKTLSDDITVTPIGVQRVSNLSGGITVYIGGIANG